MKSFMRIFTGALVGFIILIGVICIFAYSPGVLEYIFFALFLFFIVLVLLRSKGKGHKSRLGLFEEIRNNDSKINNQK